MPRPLSDQDIAAFRDRLCDAAEHLFAEHGLEAVTMRQLAEAMGVSPMTPYRYFKDKDAILAAVRARAFDRHADALEKAWRETPGTNYERATATGRAYVLFAFEHPEAYRLMFDINQPSEGDYPDLIRAAARSRATMTEHLLPMIANGEMEGDADLIGHMYWAAIHGPIMLQLSRKLEPRMPAMRIIQGLLAALDGYLRRPPPA